MTIDATAWRVVGPVARMALAGRTDEWIVEAGGAVVALDADEVALARLAADLASLATAVVGVDGGITAE